MFVLGKFAESFPGVIKQIVRGGHEIASHGYGHIEIFRQTPTQFREDVHRAKSYLEDLIGQPVVGYRAPDFSIISETLWSLDILAELGFQYDSSIFPIRKTRYGIADWPKHPVCVLLPSGRSIVELPIATFTLLGRQWPVAGGGYHRLLPWLIIRYLINRSSREGETFIAYCHPYEFDSAEFSSLELDIPLKVRLHQGLGRKGFRAKFEQMLSTFQVVPAYQIANDPHLPHYIL
jgi:polysaccharide deacetylase family protein (PEP-CTERM system associated)